MKIRYLLFVITLFCIQNPLHSQNVQHTYRFDKDLAVAQPECGPLLTQAKSPGNCPLVESPGTFIEDELACGIKRKVYHNNLNWGLMYPNSEGAITDNYTIQLYVKVTNWGLSDWVRIIDFSNGEHDEGVYFKREVATSNDRCLSFFPAGIAGECPYFNSNTYYLLTFTRNGKTGVVDVYVNNTLFTSYDDSQGRYVGKAGTPIYIFRDDRSKSCETGEANFAYLSFSDKYFAKNDVDRTYYDICFVANINTYADFSITPNPSCNIGENIVVDYSGIIPRPGTGYDFIWDFAGGKVISGSGMGPYVINWDTRGTKNVSLKVVSKGCGNSLFNGKQALVAELDLETTVISGDCSQGETPVVKLSGQKGAGPYAYSFDTKAFKADSVYSLAYGDYKVSVKDQNGCITEKNFKVEYNGDVQVGIEADSVVCFGDQLTLNATGNGQKFQWSPPAGLDDATVQQPVATPQETIEYTVTAYKGSCSATASYTVKVAPKVEVTVTPDTLVQTGVPFHLSATSPQVPNPNEANYVWSPPLGLNDPSLPGPVAILQDDQSYTVEVTASNGCKGGGSVNLRIDRPEMIFMPTAFTPNGDGINEKLVPILSGINSINYYRIYNRWGEMVFHTSSIHEGWDGILKGSDPIVGAYVWEIEGISFKGKTIKKRGSVILLK